MECVTIVATVMLSDLLDATDPSWLDAQRNALDAVAWMDGPCVLVNGSVTRVEVTAEDLEALRGVEAAATAALTARRGP